MWTDLHNAKGLVVQFTYERHTFFQHLWPAAALWAGIWTMATALNQMLCFLIVTVMLILF